MQGEVTKSGDALGRAARLVGEARGDLDKDCKELRNALADMASLWAGAGASAFAQVYTQWRDQTDQVILELDTFETNLKRSEATYAQEDHAAQTRISKLEGRLGPRGTR